ncbi:MAG TPA: PP2C family protein-serine/threonine phosphatase [Mycobacteriales bacterium]
MMWHQWERLAGSGPRLRRLLGDAGAAAALIALAGVLALCSLAYPTEMRPATVLAVPVLLGGLALPLREMRVLLAACVVMIVLVVAARDWRVSVGSALTFVVIAIVSYEQSRRRQRLGVRRARPDRILLDLRERLRVQGEVPPLPRGWGIEVELRPAYDAGMAGDFVASRVHEVDAPDGRHTVLDLVLVDVSGKGADAGTRALLLSGALGGLLGAVPPEDFLAEANRYLRQQRWTEGFATAVYLRVDLRTGAYRVESAGHPPAAHLDAGSGTWRLSPGRGPLLGVVPVVGHPPDTGVLRRGDAVLLYSDGVVEDRHRDIEVGVDRLLGAAERLVPRGDYRGGAAFLVQEVPTDTTDDRAVVMIWREY